MLIHSHSKDYAVHFTKFSDSFPRYASEDQKIVVVDQHVYDIYRDAFNCFDRDDLVLFDAAEENKSIEKCLYLYKRLLRLNAKRNALLLAIGGGIVQDVTGFVASTAYRGIQWIFWPTTLLAQADSCIGAKTSLNFEGNKNLLGTFYAPGEIHIDPRFTLSLKEEDFRSGLGEIIKLHILSGTSDYCLLEHALPELLSRNLTCLTDFIERSLKIKKSYIEADEYDFGIRRILNYGHTFGHAIESITEFTIPHGQAILYGILIANAISEARGLLSKSLEDRIISLCVQAINVPFVFDQGIFSRFINILKQDKKREGKEIVAILINQSMKAEVYSDIQPEEIQFALEKISCETNITS